MIAFILSPLLLLTLLTAPIYVCRCDDSPLRVNSLRKCCDENEHLVVASNNGSRYECSWNNYKLYNYYAPDDRPSAREAFDDRCVDVALDRTDVRLLLLDGSRALIRQLEPHAVVDRFRKCCPLGYVYSTPDRRCAAVPRANRTRLMASASLVAVGFTRCNYTVIRDDVFDSLDDARDRVARSDYERYCLDATVDARYVVRRCESIGVCNGDDVLCLTKCCPDGYNYNRSNYCSPYPHYESGFDYRAVTNVDFKREVLLVNGVRCKRSPKRNFTIDENGVVTTYAFNMTRTTKDYCIEYVNTKYMLFVCGARPTSGTKLIVIKTGLIVSSVFLLLTIVVYWLLNDVHNCYAKCLICYCLCLFVTFVLLLTVNFNPKLTSDTACSAIGFSIQFFAIATVSWITILCIDMWFTFGMVRDFGVHQKHQERKKFLKYTAIAWSIPIVCVSLTVIFERYRILAKEFTPLIGIGQCMIQKSTYGYHIFYVLPIATLTFINIVLFIKTTYYCIKVKDEINKRKDIGKRKSFLMDKERLLLLIKLTIVMGVPFTFEVITTTYSPDNQTWQTIALVFDVINALQGLFIFMIFTLKRKIKKEIYKKLGMLPLRRISHTSTVSTHLNSTSIEARNSSRAVSMHK